MENLGPPRGPWGYLRPLYDVISGISGPILKKNIVFTCFSPFNVLIGSYLCLIDKNEELENESIFPF